MKTETFAIGTLVTDKKTGTEHTIKSYDRGWYTTDKDHKFRHNQLALFTRSKKKGKDKKGDHEGISANINNYREGYHKTVAASGRKSLNNGDDVANILAGVELETIIKCSEPLLGINHGDLMKKYGHMNPGQIRMNIGNRLRYAIKREDFTSDDLATAIINNS